MIHQDTGSVIVALRWRSSLNQSVFLQMLVYRYNSKYIAPADVFSKYQHWTGTLKRSGTKKSRRPKGSSLKTVCMRVERLFSNCSVFKRKLKETIESTEDFYAKQLKTSVCHKKVFWPGACLCGNKLIRSKRSKEDWLHEIIREY